MDSRLGDKIVKFNAKADDHVKKQAVNPFRNDSVKNMTKREFAKDEYGRPAKGSKSETRGFRASALVYKEMLQLCEIIHDYGGPSSEGDPRRVICFGELFSMYNTISNKLVGILLRTRKHQIIDFEGECLFQRRDDAVPIVLLKPIEEIRKEFHHEIDTTLSAIEKNKKSQELPRSTESDDSD
ncbi:Costars [Popillia japonica]|uniref:Costars n=1 Tax=Popillia japonica TaxID=7064 RepID=A0AAW1KN72_POPJA